MNETTIAAAQAAQLAITLDPKSADQAAAFIAKRVTERRNTIPILSHIHLAADPAGFVTMTGTDRDTFASVTVPAIVGSPGAICLESGPLSDAIAKVRKGGASELSITVNDNGRAHIKGGRANFNMPAMPADDFPATPTMGEDDGQHLSRFTMPADGFLADLAALAPCQSSEESRYYLNGIALQVRDMAGRDRLTMAATDGYAIGIASRALPDGAAMLQDSILSRKAVALVGHAAKLASADLESIALEFGPRLASIAIGDVVIVSKLIDGTFPDWARPFIEQLAPTAGEAVPMFPELIPGAPLAHMAKVEKGVGLALDWYDAANGKLGIVPGDDGLLFGCMNVQSACEPIKGFRYGYEHDQARAAQYLQELAIARHGPIPAKWNAGGLKLSGADCLGMTFGATSWQEGYTVERPNWETLAVERVYIPAQQVWADGSYSIVMPRERAAMRADVTLEIDGDASTYPIAQNSAGAIHLSADQVARIAGTADTRVIQVRTRGGRTANVYAAVWEGGALHLEPCKANGGEIRKGFAVDTQIARRDVIWTSADGDLQANGEPHAAEPIEMPEIAPLAVAEPVCEAEPGEHNLNPETNTEGAPDALAALLARVEAIEAALATLPAESADHVAQVPNLVDAAPPTGGKAARTPAHERAIRRAWAERKAARCKQFMVDLRIDQLANANRRADYFKDAMETKVRHLSAQLAATRTNMEKWATEARKGRKAKSRRLATAQRARRMLAAARKVATFQRQRADVLAAQLDKLRSDMADPRQPERASDLAKLIRERDEARNAAAATGQRNQAMQRALDDLAERFEGMATRVAVAEAAARRMAG